MQVAPKWLLSKIVTHMVDADRYSFDMYFDWLWYVYVFLSTRHICNFFVESCCLPYMEYDLIRRWWVRWALGGATVVGMLWPLWCPLGPLFRGLHGSLASGTMWLWSWLGVGCLWLGWRASCPLSLYRQWHCSGGSFLCVQLLVPDGVRYVVVSGAYGLAFFKLWGQTASTSV